MTSMPASRRAAATTLAPRSCPSRPGLATRTRIGRFLRFAILEEHRLAVGPVHGFERMPDLEERAIGAGAVEHGPDDVLISLRRHPQGFEPRLDQRIVTARPERGHLRLLRVFGFA